MLCPDVLSCLQSNPNQYSLVLFAAFLLYALLCCTTCNLGQQEPPADGAANEAEHSFSSMLVGAVNSVGDMVNTVFNAEDKLPAFESAAKDLVHPLFEQLKTSIWELVPATLQDVLDDLVGHFASSSVCIACWKCALLHNHVAFLLNPWTTAGS
jgi:hypothetical protein